MLVTFTFLFPPRIHIIRKLEIYVTTFSLYASYNIKKYFLYYRWCSFKYWLD